MGKRLAFAVVCAVALLLLAAPAALAGISLQEVAPGHVSSGQTVHTSITGSFHAPLGESVGSPVFTLVRGSTRITGTTTALTTTIADVDFDLPQLAPTGWYRLEATQDWTPIQAPSRRSMLSAAKRFALSESASLDSALSVYHTPVITSVTPQEVPQGSGDLTLTVLGSGFTQSSDGAPGSWVALYPVGQLTPIKLASTCTSSGQVTGVVPAVAMMTAQEYSVVVFNPADESEGIYVHDSVDSGPLPKFIVSGTPRPRVIGCEPDYLWAGYDVPLSLGIGASGVLPTATLYVNDVVRPATWMNWERSDLYLPGVLAIIVQPAELAAPGKLKVQVANVPEFMSGAEYVEIRPETTAPTVSLVLPGGPDTVYSTPIAAQVGAEDLQSGLKTIQYRCPPLVDEWKTVADFQDSARRAVQLHHFTVPLGDIGLNTYTVEVRASDWCGHTATASQAVQMKRIRPVTLPLANVTGKLGTTVKLPFRVRESATISPTVDVTVNVYRATGHIVKSLSIKAVPVNTDHVTYLKLSPALFKVGNYFWKVFATDQYGTSQLKPMSKQLIVTAP